MTEKIFEVYDFGGRKLSNFSFDACTYRFYENNKIEEKTQGLRHYKVQNGTVDILVDNIHINNSSSKVVISGENKNIKIVLNQIERKFGFKLEEIRN